MINCT